MKTTGECNAELERELPPMELMLKAEVNDNTIAMAKAAVELIELENLQQAKSEKLVAQFIKTMSQCEANLDADEIPVAIKLVEIKQARITQRIELLEILNYFASKISRTPSEPILISASRDGRIIKLEYNTGTSEYQKHISELSAITAMRKYE